MALFTAASAAIPAPLATSVFQIRLNLPTFPNLNTNDCLNPGAGPNTLKYRSFTDDGGLTRDYITRMTGSNYGFPVTEKARRKCRAFSRSRFVNAFRRKRNRTAPGEPGNPW